MNNISILVRDSIRTMELDSSTDEESENIEILGITTVYDEIDNYKEKRLDIDADLMQYWQQKRYILSYLAKLAQIIHAVPATQVSVKRTFSALKIIMSDRRYNISTENLEKVMFVKLNSK